MNLGMGPLSYSKNLILCIIHVYYSIELILLTPCYRVQSRARAETIQNITTNTLTNTLTNTPTPTEPCKGGNYLDPAAGCKPCPEHHYSGGGSVTECTQCPGGRGASPGSAVTEEDCNMVIPGERRGFLYRFQVFSQF